MPRITKQISSFTQSEIKELFKTTRIVINQEKIVMRVGPAKKEIGRLLLVISRKVGSAPQRNLLRRRLKSIFYQDKFYTLHKDCIIIARPGITTIPYEELRTLLQQAFNT